MRERDNPLVGIAKIKLCVIHLLGENGSKRCSREFASANVQRWESDSDESGSDADGDDACLRVLMV